MGEFVEARRTAGDKQGEAYLMHKWATMTQFPDIAMNTAQAAKQIAADVGAMSLVLSINKSITDLWVAKGKPEKAPTRKQALVYLKDMAECMKVKEDEKGYTAFLEENEFWPKEGGATSGDQSGGEAFKKFVTVPYAWHYVLFRYGGLGYGPRYRCCFPIKDLLSPGCVQSVVCLQDVHDDWERELAYNPSMPDCGLQTGAGAAYNPATMK